MHGVNSRSRLAKGAEWPVAAGVVAPDSVGRLRRAARFTEEHGVRGAVDRDERAQPRVQMLERDRGALVVRERLALAGQCGR